MVVCHSIQTNIDENQARAVAAGGIEVIVKVIETHINNYNICEKSFELLQDIASNNSKTHITRISVQAKQ